MQREVTGTSQDKLLKSSIISEIDKLSLRISSSLIYGSTAQPCTANVTNERARDDYRQSAKKHWSVSHSFVLQNTSADITTK